MKRAALNVCLFAVKNAALGVALLGALFCADALAQPPVTLTIDAAKPLHPSSPLLYGALFDDANCGEDGELHGEMIQNRSFEFKGKDAFASWALITQEGAKAKVTVETERPLSVGNPHFLRMEVIRTGERIGLANFGFGGIPIQKGSNYIFSVYARSPGKNNSSLDIFLENPKGQELATARVSGLGPEWSRCSAVLEATKTETNAHLAVILGAAGTMDFDLFSLIPERVFNNRSNGLRADLAQLAVALKPSFVQFPGSRAVAGRDLASRYRWKESLRDVPELKSGLEAASPATNGEPATHYFPSSGPGFYEYFMFCEEIGAEPLPMVNCGMASQDSGGELAPMAQLDAYIQDALDLVEFANGPSESLWGARRAALGHATPFYVKMLGIGGAHWGEDYLARAVRFSAVFKQRHPEIELVFTVGPESEDARFRQAETLLRELNAGSVAENLNSPPGWLLENTFRYDAYDRQGPKTLANIGAAPGLDRPNTLGAALAEAAFLTGLERNSDAVPMMTGAPLFARDLGAKPAAGLILFDKTRAVLTPSYHVLKLFSANQGSAVLPVEMIGALGSRTPSGGIALGTSGAQAEFRDVRVVSGSHTLFQPALQRSVAGWNLIDGDWTAGQGALRQTNETGTALATAGDNRWADYTLSLKARKISGSNGVLIRVRCAADGSGVQWNLGGAGDTAISLEDLSAGKNAVLGTVAGGLETGRWYDVRIELRGPTVDCFMDDVLVQTAEIPVSSAPRLFATASHDSKTQTLILKAVNPGAEPIDAQIRLEGFTRIDSKAEAVGLAGDSPTVRNTFDVPNAAAPETNIVRGAGPDFHWRLKPYSAAVLRLGAER